MSAPTDPEPAPGCLAMLGAFLVFGALALVGLEVWVDRFAWPIDPSWYRLEEADGVVTFGCQNFAPVRFATTPPEGRRRVVLLGGSSAFGFPERPVGEAPLDAAAHGIGGALQATLDARWPGRFEVVNLGVNGGTSEDTLRLARRAMAWSPAALVVYDGNNEFMDVPRHVTPSLWRFALYRRTTVFREKARAAPGPVGPPAWTDDATRDAVLARLRRDLDTVAGLAADAGVPLVLSTQAANLADFDPSWSTVGDPAVLATLAERADDEVEAAWATTPDSADLAWAVGRRRLAAGRDAAAALQAAVDHDGMAFRPTTAVNDAVREVAAARGAVLVDAGAAVADLAGPGSVPGEAEFYDWVHPRPEAAAAIGGAIAAGLARAGLLPDDPGAPVPTPPPSDADAVARDVRVAVSWTQWACVRAHDPAFRLAAAERWARAALARDPAHALATALLRVTPLLADPAARLDAPLPEAEAARLAGVHPCVAARLGRDPAEATATAQPSGSASSGAVR